jgi:hypothetical protein
VLGNTAPYGLYLHFPDNWKLSSFSYTDWPSSYLCGEILKQVLCVPVCVARDATQGREHARQAFLPLSYSHNCFVTVKTAILLLNGMCAFGYCSFIRCMVWNIFLFYFLGSNPAFFFPIFILFYFHFSFFIHMCIQVLCHFSPLPPPPPLPPTPPYPSPPHPLNTWQKLFCPYF